VVFAAALLAGGLGLRSPQVDAVQLRQAPLVRTLQFSARVATLSRVDVGSTITGRVAQVLVAEGAQVRRGDALLRLESDELVAAVTQAVAAERQAAARLAGLRSTGREPPARRWPRPMPRCVPRRPSSRGWSSWWRRAL
jgi:HlyD family secretion protein